MSRVVDMEEARRRLRPEPEPTLLGWVDDPGWLEEWEEPPAEVRHLRPEVRAELRVVHGGKEHVVPIPGMQIPEVML